MIIKELFQTYPHKLILQEIWRRINGKYLSWKQVTKLLERSHVLMSILIFNALSCIFLIWLFGSAITSSLSQYSDPYSYWRSMTPGKVFLGDVDRLVSKENVTQPILFNFAVYSFFMRMLIITLFLLYLLFMFKCFIATSVMSHTKAEKNLNLIGLDIVINPFPIYALLKMRKMEVETDEKEIDFQAFINRFLALQQFPEEANEKTLVNTANLGFRYEKTFDFEKIWHQFLKRFFPALYYQHFLLSNNRQNHDRRSKKDFIALNNVNISIKEGTFTSILGCNGSSKSTFLKAIINLFDDYSGKIVWLSKDLKKISTKSFFRNVSYSAQDSFIQTNIQVYDYVACGLFPSLSFFRFNYPKDHPVILDSLNKMGLMELKDKQVNQLSGGERQKVILARILTQQTKIIVLDEPTTYLDISNQYLILNILKKLQKEENKTIIAILHDIRQAEQFSDEVILLNEGRVHSYGKTNEVLRKENIQKVFSVSDY